MKRVGLVAKKHIPIFALAVGVSLWMLLAITGYITNLTRIETQLADNSLMGTAESNGAEVRFTFERYISAMEIAVVAIEGYNDLKAPEVLSLLEQMSEIKGYEYLAIDFPNGMSITSTGKEEDNSSLGFLGAIKNGKPFISDVIEGKLEEKSAIGILVPIHDKAGQVIAALRCMITTESLTNTFNQTFVDSNGYYRLIDGNGSYVAANRSTQVLLHDKNFFDSLDKLTLQEGFSAEAAKKDFREQTKGFMKYSFNGQHRNSYYAPVGINNWVVMMIVPKEIIDQTSNLHRDNAFFLMAQIVIILLIIMLYVYYNQKNARNKALLSEKCFMALAEQTNKVIFEWDFSINKITSLTNFKVLFGRDAVTQNSAADALNVKAVHEEDKAAFSSIFTAVLSGNPVSDIRFRIRDVNGVYHWCTLSGIVIRDHTGKPYKAIGSLENIDEQVKKEEMLKQKAEKDALTGLYNKAITEYLIKEILEHPSIYNDQHALMIIDVDNFKNINDKLGHLYGDIVLSSLADVLKQIFRSDDIVGRIGGDEFFVFLKNFNGIGLVEAKAKEICKFFLNTYTENNISVTISASIGIAICPEHGVDFDVLYRSADTALYNTKASGKNNYTFFDGKTVNIYQSNRTEIDTNGIIQKNFKENKVEYLLNLLYNSEKPIAAVKSVLKLVAENFAFSRGYIFEKMENKEVYVNIHEWCGENVMPITPTFGKIATDEIKDLITFFQEKEIYSFPDAELEECVHFLNMVQAKSSLLFAIKNNDKLLGFIGFDDCQKSRDFTSAQLDEYASICKVLSTFLVKQRVMEKSRLHELSLKAVLDNIDGYSYVVDKDSYEVLFENNNISGLMKANNVGNCCYKAYMDRETPCNICPLSGLSENKSKNSVEIYHHGIHSKTTGSFIDWIDGGKACLISCIDISEYKKP